MPTATEINKKYKEEKKLKKLKEKKTKDFKKAITRSRKPKKTKEDKPKLNLRTILKKYHSGEQLFKYEEVYAVKKLIEKADKVFGAFIRSRDAGRGCVSYGAEGCENTVAQCCHWIGRAWYSHRRDEENCFGGCVSCNCYHAEEHKLYFTKKQIELHGIEWVREQLKIRNKIKPKIDELLNIVEKYKK